MKDQKDLIREMKAVVGDMYVVHEPEDLIVFEQDGSVDRGMPLAVVLPGSSEEVSEVVRAAHLRDLPIVARARGRVSAAVRSLNVAVS